MNKKVLIIIGIILVVGFSATFVYFWQKSGQENNTAIDMTDWQTYKNEEYGFEVKYPKGINPKFYSHKTRPQVSFVEGEKTNYAVKINLLASRAEVDNFYFLDFPISRKEKLAGQEAGVTEAPRGYCDGPSCGSPFIAYSTKKGDIFYSLVFFNDIELNEDEKYILESFKFINE